MPRAKLDAVASSLNGTAVQFAAPTIDGDAVRAHTALLVRNAGTADVTLTLVTAGTADGLGVEDPTRRVPAGGALLLGPFPNIFPQGPGPDEGWVFINYSAVAGVDRLNLALGR